MWRRLVHRSRSALWFRHTALAALAIVYSATFADKGQATFPGSPGAIAVERSPDPFARLSDIWLVNWQTGAATQLTHRGYNRSPAFSPNGRRIAFVNDLPRGQINIWSVRSDGSGLRRLTKGRGELEANSPAFSADGRWVAFSAVSRDGAGEIDRVASNGGNRRVLVPGSGRVFAFDPSYSPDGQSLAWVQGREDSRASAQIFIGRANGSHGRPVTTGFAPEFSPDGRSLVFLTEGRCSPRLLRMSIWTLSLETGLEREVKKSCGSNLGNPTYSPDGGWIAYTAYTAEQSDIGFIRVPGVFSQVLPLNGFGIDLPIDAAPSWQPV